MPAPSWIKNAIATVYGWAHPLTGEQLIGRISAEDAQNAVAFYRPNAGRYSFIDPESAFRTNVSSMVNGKKVILQINSLEKVLGVDWKIDGQPVEGGLILVHQFQEDGLYNISADVSVEIDGTPSINFVYTQVRVGEVVAPEVVAPELSSVKIYGGENGDIPVAVGVEAWFSFSFVSTPDWSTLTHTTTWELDGVVIPGATVGHYTPVEGDAGKTLTATFTVSNSAGSSTMTSDGVVVLAA